MYFKDRDMLHQPHHPAGPHGRECHTPVPVPPAESYLHVDNGVCLSFSESRSRPIVLTGRNAQTPTRMAGWGAGARCAGQDLLARGRHRQSYVFSLRAPFSKAEGCPCPAPSPAQTGPRGPLSSHVTAEWTQSLFSELRDSQELKAKTSFYRRATIHPGHTADLVK